MPTFMLIASVALQLTGAAFALRFIRRSERRLPWIVLALALVLMAGRRLVTLALLHLEGAPTSMAAEFIALVVSLCVVVGISGLRPLIDDVRRRSQAEVDERRRAEILLRNHLELLESAVANLVEHKTLRGQVGRILGSVAEQLNADRAQLWLQRDDHLELAVEWPSLPDGAAAAIRPRGAAARALDSRRAVVWHAEEGDDGHGLSGCECAGSTLLVPLVQGEERLGLYAVCSPTPKTFASEELRIASSLASQVTAAVLMDRLAEQSRDAAVVDERNRLAGEIHDTLAQGFAGIQRLLEASLAAPNRESKRAGELVSRALSVATGSLAEARRSVWQLRPARATGEPLAAQLSTMARRVCRDSPVLVNLESSGEPDGVSAKVRSELLKIAQEATLNAVRHGRPRRIDIGLAPAAGGLQLSVRDDGRGMAEASGASSAGFGLLGMRERASRIGGRLRIESVPGRGTTVTVEAPLVQQSAE